MQTNFYYSLLNGDKDTFRFSWRAAQTPFKMVPFWPAAVGSANYEYDDKVNHSFCGHTMVQHDFEGNIAFLHHNNLHVEHLLPVGDNFALIQQAHSGDAAGGDRHYRAAPLPSMLELAGGTLINCLQIEYTDTDKYHLTAEIETPSSLSAWESYLCAC